MGDKELDFCEEMGESFIVPTFSEKLNDWLSRSNAESAEVKLFVYKFEGNGDEKALCGKYSGNEIPDEHDLGLEHGSGRFLAIAHIPTDKGKKTNSWRFRISPRYDELKKQKILENNPYAPYPYAMPPVKGEASLPVQTAPVDNIKQLAELVSVLKPLLAPTASPLQEMQFGQKIMMQNFEAMNEMMKASLLDTNKAIREALRHNLNGDISEGEYMQNDEEEEEDKGILGQLEQVLPLLEQFIPKLLAKGPQGNVTAAMVRGLPQYKEIANNAEAVKSLIAFVEKKHGKEATEALLKKLKIARPI